MLLLFIEEQDYLLFVSFKHDNHFLEILKQFSAKYNGNTRKNLSITNYD